VNLVNAGPHTIQACRDRSPDKSGVSLNLFLETPGSQWLPQDKSPLLKRIVNLRRPPWLGTTTRESGALAILAMRCARTRGHRPVHSSRWANGARQEDHAPAGSRHAGKAALASV